MYFCCGSAGTVQQAAEASLERLVLQMLSVIVDLKGERLDTFLKQIRMRGYDEGRLQGSEVVYF